jgi:PIN domain nuclease of toxin-antitoxin system
MKLLLDTHAVIWWTGSAADHRKISGTVRERIENETNDILVSSATAWEMAIKAQSGKLRIDSDILDNYDTRLAALGWITLPILPRHALAAPRLPGGHKDPFDRMLAAQALVEGLTLATVDRHFAAFGVSTIW